MKAAEKLYALPTLRKGSKGEAVVYLQQLLNAGRYGEEIDEDGIFGSATEASVKSFQRENGLVADGIVGPLTWSALEYNDDTKDGQEEAPSEENSASPVMTIEQRLERLELAVFGQGGGDSNG